MSDDSNIFAGAETVGQLFDALWYAGMSTARANLPSDTTWTEWSRRSREIAVADAHKRYEELIAKPLE
ncbi:hypothetical protein BI081_gp110 [Mycobacterium phage Tonenili]|uniref:Uncharacterized protein n=1 Tax=Mycobacterium phage Tonenili TaxID=1891703 RepID=A0A1C9EHN0_9CAUD|nr:hypothetical protein BI081_gp110 [Mycobacterium phage Tonenili]AON96997.1 hypothetical protein SEA_TONENILI_279 [Mycobacterium phage Tonenili]